MHIICKSHLHQSLHKLIWEHQNLVSVFSFSIVSSSFLFYAWVMAYNFNLEPGQYECHFKSQILVIFQDTISN